MKMTIERVGVSWYAVAVVDGARWLRSHPSRAAARAFCKAGVFSEARMWLETPAMRTAIRDV